MERLSHQSKAWLLGLGDVVKLKACVAASAGHQLLQGIRGRGERETQPRFRMNFNRCEWNDVDINLIICLSAVVATWTARLNKPKSVFFSVQNHKSISLQSVRKGERLGLSNNGNVHKKFSFHICYPKVVNLFLMRFVFGLDFDYLPVTVLRLLNLFFLLSLR